jgi:hypothetical protein
MKLSSQHTAKSDDAFEHDEPQMNLRTAKVLGLDLPAASGLDISTQSSLQGRN